MKQCTQCKEWKNESEFSRNRTKPGGLNNECKKCHNARQQAYKKSDAGKATTYRYYHSPKGQATIKRYAQSEKEITRRREYSKSEAGRERYRKFRQTEQGKQLYRQISKNYRDNHPEKFKAQDMVNKAIRAGKMPRPDTLLCQWPNCDQQAEEYHHHSYEPEHWYDVQALCIKHHNAIHGKV